MPQSKVIIQKSKGKKKGWYVIVKADNGKVLLTSEILSSKRNALKNIEATMTIFHRFFSNGKLKITTVP